MALLVERQPCCVEREIYINKLKHTLSMFNTYMALLAIRTGGTQGHVGVRPSHEVRIWIVKVSAQADL